MKGEIVEEDHIAWLCFRRQGIFQIMFLDFRIHIFQFLKAQKRIVVMAVSKGGVEG